MTTGEKIKARRKAMEMTLSELAQRVGCSTSAISQYERGTRQPNTSMLLALANALDCGIDELDGNNLFVSIKIDNMNTSSVDIYTRRAADRVISQVELPELLQFARGYLDLSNEGRKRLFEYLDELTQIPAYQRQIAPKSEEHENPEDDSL